MPDESIFGAPSHRESRDSYEFRAPRPGRASVHAMESENWINLAAALAAVAAVGISVWQARIAIAASRQAESAAAAAALSESRALEAAERSAEADTRTANALETANAETERSKREAFTNRLMSWAITIRDEAEGQNARRGPQSVISQLKKLHSESRQFDDPQAMELYEFVADERQHLMSASPEDVHRAGVAFLEELAERSGAWVRRRA